MLIATILRDVKDRGMIFSKLFHAKTRKTWIVMQILPESLLKIR